MTLSLSSIYSQSGDNYIKLSDHITTENKDILGFNKINVSEDFEVFIRFSDTEEKIEIEANENLHDLIQVEQKGNSIKIYTESYSTNNWGRKGGASEVLVAYITTKELVAIKGSEDVIFVLEDKMYADNLTIDLDEDSTLEGFLEVQNLIVKLTEDSVLDIDGSADIMNVKADEDSYIKGRNFTVNDLTIDLTEDSEATLTVNGDIDLTAREDSIFSYRGNGSFTRKKLRGDSEVNHL